MESLFERTIVGPRVHEGTLFDVYRLQGDDSTYALKVTTGKRTAPDSPELYAASAVLGGVSTVFDLWTRLGDPASDTPEQGAFAEVEAHDLGRALLEAEHARVLAAAGAWNHRTLGFQDCDVAGRGHCRGLVSPWIDGDPLANLPQPELRSLVLGMLPALWDALAQAPHGDVHASNLIVAPSRDRFSLIDPSSLVWGKRDERGASSGAWWLVFTTHARAYPFLPPYAGTCVAPGVGLRDHVEAFIASLERHFPSQSTELHTEVPPVFPKEMLEPPQPVGAPLAADWHAVALLYYAALTGRDAYADRLARPLWCGTEFINGLTRELAVSPKLRRDGPTALAALDPPIARPSSVREGVTESEDDLAAALLDLRIESRRHLVELCGRAAAALADRLTR